jgi:CTP:molybdopterin cytidylyltransferase MocA
MGLKGSFRMESAGSESRTVGIYLAAGQGKRMGAGKLDLPLGEGRLGS